MTISAAFTRVLAAGRRQFNARVEEAKRRCPAFDTGNFASFLESSVDVVIVAVDAAAPARTMAVALAAYDIALSLCMQGLVGVAARNAVVNETWSRLLPMLAARIAEQPQDVLGALSNAAVHLAGVDGARCDEWLAMMADAGPQAESVGQLLDLGKVLAWRAGMAHWRAGALAVVDGLPPALQRAALGASSQDEWAAVRSAQAADPWASTQARRSEGWLLGAFTGFGGRFAQPPKLRVGPDGFVVCSGTRHFLAIADAFGAVLLPATADEFAAAAAPRAPDTLGAQDLAFGLPAESLVIAASAHSLAIASPYTHTIRLLPLR